MAYTGKKLADLTPAQRKARVATLIKSPNTRRSVPTEYLPGSYRQTRELNTRLAAPVTPGSQLTYRDVARQAESAAQVKYGDAIRQGNEGVGQAQQLAKDQQHWYDDYQAKVAEGRDRQAQIGQQAVSQLGSLAGAFAAPDTTGQSAQNQTMEAQGAGVRQALLKNVGAVTNAQAANANSYANQLASVVVPGQKLQAQAQGAANVQKFRDQLTGLLKDRGSYKEQTKGDIITGEQKNVLANQALGLDVTKVANQAKTDAANIDIKRGVDPITGKTITKPKTGYGPGGPAQNKYGYTYDQWNNLTASQQQNARQGKGTKANNGTEWISPQQQSRAQSSIEQAIGYAKTMKGKYSRAEAAAALTTTQKGQPVFKTIKDKKTGKTRQERVLGPDGTQQATGSWEGVDSAMASAALDMAYDGHLSRYTVNKLHAAGIKVGALGLPTSGRRTVRAKLSPSERAPGGT